MLEFKDIEIKDRDWILEFLKKTPRPSMEYNFTTMFIWQKIYRSKVAQKDGFFYYMSGKSSPGFMFPIGEGDKKTAIDELFSYCEAQGILLSFFALSDSEAEFLEKNYPDRFSFFQTPDYEDYVYSKESLETLKGKALSGKRNHINRFLENNPDWKYEKITKENIHLAIAMHSEWCDNVECNKDEGLKDETCAVKRAFKYFEELKLLGGMITVGGKPVAFSIGDELSDDTFLVHIEKAYAEVQGAYPLINREFVKNECEGYEFINREDDAGDEGLRRAKMSYKPVLKVKKISAKIQ